MTNYKHQNEIQQPDNASILCSSSLPTIWSVPLCVAETCAVRPGFAQVVEELVAAEPRICFEGVMKQMLVQGRNLRLMDEAGSRGTRSPREENTRTVTS